MFMKRIKWFGNIVLMVFIQFMESLIDNLKVAGNWMKVWRLNILPKIKRFIWRVLCGCLPCRQKLRCKGVQCPITYAFYPSIIENEWHILFGWNQEISMWQATGIWQFIEQKVNAAKELMNSFSIYLDHYMEILSTNLMLLYGAVGILGMTRYEMNIPTLLLFLFRFLCSILLNGKVQGNMLLNIN